MNSKRNTSVPIRPETHEILVKCQEQMSRGKMYKLSQQAVMHLALQTFWHLDCKVLGDRDAKPEN